MSRTFKVSTALAFVLALSVVGKSPVTLEELTAVVLGAFFVIMAVVALHDSYEPS